VFKNLFPSSSLISRGVGLFKGLKKIPFKFWESIISLEINTKDVVSSLICDLMIKIKVRKAVLNNKHNIQEIVYFRSSIIRRAVRLVELSLPGVPIRIGNGS
jgi:hypothetical protein